MTTPLPVPFPVPPLLPMLCPICGKQVGEAGECGIPEEEPIDVRGY
jgi:hypothetical protein